MTLSRSLRTSGTDWRQAEIGESETEPEAINMIDTPVWFDNQILDTPRQTTRHNAAQSAAGKGGLSIYIYIYIYIYICYLSFFRFGSFKSLSAWRCCAPDAWLSRMCWPQRLWGMQHQLEAG